jgi:hypothetical protein
MEKFILTTKSINIIFDIMIIKQKSFKNLVIHNEFSQIVTLLRQINTHHRQMITIGHQIVTKYRQMITAKNHKLLF